MQVVWVFIYSIGIAAFARPQTCPPGTRSAPQQWAVTFVELFFAWFQGAVTVAAALLTMKGEAGVMQRSSFTRLRLLPSTHRHDPLLTHSAVPFIPLPPLQALPWNHPSGAGSPASPTPT